MKDPELNSHLIMEDAVTFADQAIQNVTGLGRRKNKLIAGNFRFYENLYFLFHFG